MACTKCKKKTAVDQIAVGSIESTETLSDFKLRGILGAIQMSFGSGQFVSNANLTNELAIEFLKVNPNRITMFETYPANWKDLISDTVNNESDDAQED